MRSDWFPGGRYGTHENYTQGHEATFGKQDIFKNLAKDDNDGQTVDSEDREE